MTLKSWKIFHENSLPELHDQMILSLAIERSATAIITSDPEITEKFATIW